MHNNLLITFKAILRLTQHSTYRTRNNTPCEGFRSDRAVFSVLPCKWIVIALTHFKYTTHGKIRSQFSNGTKIVVKRIYVLRSDIELPSDIWWVNVNTGLCSALQINVNYRNLNYGPGGCFGTCGNVWRRSIYGITCMSEISDKRCYSLRWKAQDVITGPKFPRLKISG